MDSNQRLRALADRFLELGRHINLSGAKDFDTLWSRHILDSLKLLELPELAKGSHVLDLGSGGGFPGLPLAIARPDLTVTLMDSVTKKMKAVQTLIDDLDIKNASVLVSRAEDLGRNKAHRQAYSVVVARAVAPLPALLEYAAPLTAIHGVFIAIQGPDAVNEVAEAEIARQKLRVDVPKLHPYTMGDATFYHVVYPVRQYVPKAYPRTQGKPRKQPLGSQKRKGQAKVEDGAVGGSQQ